MTNKMQLCRTIYYSIVRDSGRQRQTWVKPESVITL